MGLEFVIKAPNAKVKSQGIFKSLLKVNTGNNNFNFSKKVLLDLVGADEEGKANEFRAGFAYDSENKKIFLYLHPEGKKASKSGTFSDTYHAEKFVTTLGLEDDLGKVLEFEVKTEEAVENEEHGVTLYPVIFQGASEPRGARTAASTEAFATQEESGIGTETVGEMPVGPGNNAEIPEAPIAPMETTIAEQNGENPSDLADLGAQPPVAPQIGNEWPN